jgi:hypothetical protein
MFLAARQFCSSNLVGRVAPLLLAGRIKAKSQIQTLNHLKIGIFLPPGRLDTVLAFGANVRPPQTALRATRPPGMVQN